MTENRTFLVIREIGGDEEVHRIETTGKSERQIEKVQMGIMRQWRDGLYIDEVSE